MDPIWRCCIRCIVVKDINLVKTTAISGDGQRYEEHLAKAKEDTEQNTERITKTVHCAPTAKRGYSLSCSIPQDTTAIDIEIDCYNKAYTRTHHLSFTYPSGEIFNTIFTPTQERCRFMCKLEIFNGDKPTKLWYYLPDLPEELRYKYDEKSDCVTTEEITVPVAAGEPEDVDRR